MRIGDLVELLQPQPISFPDQVALGEVNQRVAFLRRVNEICTVRLRPEGFASELKVISAPLNNVPSDWRKKEWVFTNFPTIVFR